MSLSTASFSSAEYMNEEKTKACVSVLSRLSAATTAFTISSLSSCALHSVAVARGRGSRRRSIIAGVMGICSAHSRGLRLGPRPSSSSARSTFEMVGIRSAA